VLAGFVDVDEDAPAAAPREPEEESGLAAELFGLDDLPGLAFATDEALPARLREPQA
jgi:8-oxo-dGTP pyrophosphatase MutT (NUDIX family)